MKISIVTVTFNCVDFLERTILSVISQSFINMEYVIVDGGSTDGTVEIIKKYQKYLSYWCSERDNGIYDAMNKGMQHVTGEWVNFMNAGDTFADSKVLEDVFSKEIDDKTCVIAGHVIYKNRGKLSLKPAESPELIPLWMPFNHQSMFVRSRICRFDTSYKFCADYDLLYNIYMKKGIESIQILNRVISVFEMDGSTSIVNNRKTHGESLRIRSRRLSWFWIKDFIKWFFFRK